MTANALSLDSLESRARVVGHVDLGQQPELPVVDHGVTGDFLTDQAATPWSGEQMQRDLDRVLAEIAELQTENRWDDILALFHPVAEKLPELADSGMENEVRLKIGFVLCRAGRHAESIASLTPVTKQDPENCMALHPGLHCPGCIVYRPHIPAAHAVQREKTPYCNRSFSFCRSLQAAPGIGNIFLSRRSTVQGH